MPHQIHFAAVFMNHLVLAGQVDDDALVTEVRIATDRQQFAAPVLAYGGFDCAADPGEEQDEAYGFILACELGFAATAETCRSGVQIFAQLQSVDGSLAQETLPAISMFELMARVRPEALEVLADEFDRVEPTAATVIRSIVNYEYAVPQLDCHVVEHVVVPEFGYAASGYGHGLAGAEGLFLACDLKLVVNPEQVFLHEAEGTAAVNGANGFTFFDIIEDVRDLRIVAARGAKVQWSEVFKLSSPGSVADLLRLLSKHIQPSELLSRPRTIAVLQRVAQGNRNAAESNVVANIQGAAKTPSELSIIVPFYQDDFFLLDHLDSQRRTAANAEWIFVCDDPHLARPMQNMLRAHITEVPKATKLIVLSENRGYAAANNIGFREASAPYVLFMNSDVYWEEFRPIEYGIQLLKLNPSVGIVGFVLHFEDDTLQHAGMEVQSAPDWNNMLLSIHPGKGLPSPYTRAKIRSREVEAVTGALVLVRRSDFVDHVFDESFLGGDFEDADLCLRVRARGKKVMLVECPGLFHLERQSIGATKTHGLFTTLNCAQFTQRWRPTA